MKRRSILAAGLVPLVAGRSPAGMTAIVIGSGLAGAVASSRLTQAGIRTTVLGQEDSVVPCLEQPRRHEWNLAYPPALYDEMGWQRARRGYPRPAVTAGPVTEIREASGAFQVRTANRTYTADFLFMAAGTIETASLLVTAKARGWLPRLGDEVGKGFGTNGAFLVAWLNARHQPAPFVDESNPVAPAAISGEAVPNAQLILSMAPERGEIRYDAASGTAKVHWPYAPMEATGDKAARDLVTRLWWQGEGKRGRLLRGLPHYDRAAGLGAATTRHPLGGMVMGKATDHSGRSLDYPNLYCLDGSVLPGTTCLASPALTIAANAERIMDRFLAAQALG